jgi:hypothetical protein
MQATAVSNFPQKLWQLCHVGYNAPELPDAIIGSTARKNQRTTEAAAERLILRLARASMAGLMSTPTTSEPGG